MSSYQTIHEENLKEIERLNTIIQDGVITEVRKQLEVDDINFTGDLSKSVVKVDNINGMKGVEVQSPYGIPVNYGMPAGIYVNVEELKKWVIGKLGVSDEKEAEKIAWKIRYKILNKGIAPTRFFKKGIKRFVAKAGISNMSVSTSPRRKRSGVEKFLNSSLKAVRKANKNLRRINKFTNTINRVRKGRL